jgi:hypothetical protein
MTPELIETPEPMVSWHGDAGIKEKYLARVEAHRLADELVRGTGFEGGRGCAVGCTFDKYDHARGPIEIGVPGWLVHLEDVIFEGLPQEKAMFWPTQFLEAIPVGANLEPVQWQLAILRHKRQLAVLATNLEPYARGVKQALHLTIGFCEMMLTAPELANALATADAARSAVSSATPAVSSMASAVAVMAAYSAAYSAEFTPARSAATAARSMAYSASQILSSVDLASSAALLAHYEWEAETLIMLLRETAITPKVAC